MMINKSKKLSITQKILGVVKLPKWVKTQTPEEFIFKMR